MKEIRDLVNNPYISSRRWGIPPAITKIDYDDQNNKCPLGLTEQDCWLSETNKRSYGAIAFEILNIRSSQDTTPMEQVSEWVDRLSSMPNDIREDLDIKNITRCAL